MMDFDESTAGASSAARAPKRAQDDATSCNSNLNGGTAVAGKDLAVAPEQAVRDVVGALRDLLTSDRHAGSLPEEMERNYPDAANLAHDLVLIRDFALALAQGNLDHPLRIPGVTAAGLKSLQANLRHMTWRAQQVAEGDFTQRVAFLGAFSDAFNTMVTRLDQNRTLLHRQEEDLRERLDTLQAEVQERKRAEEALRESEMRYEALLDNAPFPVVIFRMSDMNVVYVNERATELFRITRDAALGWRFAEDHIDPVIRAKLISKMQANGRISDAEVKLTRHGEEDSWVSISGALIHHDGVPMCMAAFNDVSDRKRMEETLRALAARDALTGIMNRYAITDYANGELARAEREGTQLALAMVDIDYFKSVNDAHGHLIGDVVLKEVVRRTCESVRPYDGVGRYGGDEFIIILPRADRESGTTIAERVRASVSGEPIQVGELTLHVTVSVGIAVSSVGDIGSLTSLIREADAALYLAKQHGRNRIVAHDTRTPDATTSR